MRKSFLKLLVLILVTVYAGADTKSFLWKVEGGKKVSWLLGSVHVMKKDVYPLPEKMVKAFDSTDKLVVEANISPEKAQSMAMLTLSKCSYKDGTTLKDVLDDETEELLEARLKKSGMSMALFPNYKPWFVAMTVLQIELQKCGFDPSLGIDRFFLDRAKDKKEIIELEGVEYQLNLFDGFSKEEQCAFLKYSLMDESSTAEGMDKLVAMWKSGDTDGMNKYMTEVKSKHSELEDVYTKLIDTRNEEMVDKLRMMFKRSSKSYFVVVGAAHMIGKNGIVELLKKKGFKVTRF